MDLRRALLLFAIVLGIAALVTALTSADRGGSRPEAPPVVSEPVQAPDPGSAALRFDAGRAPVTRNAAVGSSATVSVAVDDAGQVQLRGLGLTASAEPGAPARFDVFTDRAGSYPVSLTPAAGGASRLVGTLRVRSPSR